MYNMLLLFTQYDLTHFKLQYIFPFKKALGATFKLERAAQALSIKV